MTGPSLAGVAQVDRAALTAPGPTPYNPDRFGQELRRNSHGCAANHQRASYPELGGAVHERHSAVSSVRLLCNRSSSALRLRREGLLQRERPRGAGNPPGHQGIRELADDPAALRQRRVRGWVRHPARDVPNRRAAKAADEDAGVSRFPRATAAALSGFFRLPGRAIRGGRPIAVAERYARSPLFPSNSYS